MSNKTSVDDNIVWNDIILQSNKIANSMIKPYLKKSIINKTRVWIIVNMNCNLWIIFEVKNS